MLRLPTYNFRPAHADPLHFDLWSNGENILRDAGTFSYNSNPTDVNYFKGLYVPNALTPDENGGEASIFLPKGRSLKEYKMQIFDKWGNLIFETNQLNELNKLKDQGVLTDEEFKKAKEKILN